MSAILPRLRVGDPLRHNSLSVFPLFSNTEQVVEYRLSEAALADESLLVEEVSEGGSVPDLLVDNKGDLRVLFLEGEELVGAKQNRVLNTSVLVAAHSKTKIPVSCVEQGRWGYKSRQFGSSGSHSPSKVRSALKASVSRSVIAKLGHRSDQRKIWQEVQCFQEFHNVESSTAAMSDVFDSFQDRITAYRDKLPYVEGATGLAVAIGWRVVSIDVFDKPTTCHKVWGRLLTGAILDASEEGDTDRHATVDDVVKLVTTAGDLPWERSQAVGEGEEYRAQSQQGDQASALAFEDTMVHGSVIAAV